MRRLVETVSRGERVGIHFTVIENSPAIRNLIHSIDYEPVAFRIPLDNYEDVLVVRLLMWVYYVVKATVVGLKLLVRRDFRIVMTYSGELFCTAMPAFIVHSLSGIPLVYVVQLTPPGLPSSGITWEYGNYRSQGFNVLKAASLSIYAYVMRVIIVRLYDKAQLIIVVSESMKKQLLQYGVRRRIDVIPNGIDSEEMEKVVYSGRPIYDAIFVGRHTPEKGVFELIEVWRNIVETIPAALLVTVGYCTSDVEKLIKKRISQSGLEKNILVKGVVPRNELILLMKQSKTFLFLSREESFSLAVGEALACGLPVVCSDILPIREFYNMDAVLRCPVGDTNCVAKKMLELLLNQELRNELHVKASKFIRRYRWTETVQKELQLYRSLIR